MSSLLTRSFACSFILLDLQGPWCSALSGARCSASFCDRPARPALANEPTPGSASMLSCARRSLAIIRSGRNRPALCYSGAQHCAPSGPAFGQLWRSAALVLRHSWPTSVNFGARGSLILLHRSALSGARQSFELLPPGYSASPTLSTLLLSLAC